MNRQQAIDLVRKTFESPFERDGYIRFLRELLNGFDDEGARVNQGARIPEKFQDYVEKMERVGKYSAGKSEIMLFIVYLKKETSIERARTMQRNFVAWYLSQGNKDAALAAFVSPNSADWRFSLVKMDYRFEERDGKTKVKEEFTPARRWSFLVGANEKSHTAQSKFVPILEDDENNPTLERLEEAFNIEKVTKEFFEKYRDLFIRTKEALDKAIAANPAARSDFEAKGVDTVNLAKKLLGQIIFLYFLQKKGWFGVPRDEAWGKGSKNFLRELFEKKHGGYKNFFNDILEPLFYEALRIDRSHDDHYYSRFNCKIPFLNGGLFDPMNNYDWVHTDILLPDSLFSNKNKTKEGDTGDGILDVFDRYNFTVKEDEPFEKEVAIDPELLGKAYEKFNAIRPDNYDEFLKALKSGKKGEESKFNKQYGVYYTPREIVHYMCQQSLINYLYSELNVIASEAQQSPSGREIASGRENAAPRNDIITKEDIETLILRGEQIKEHDVRVVAEGRETKDYPFRMPESIRRNAARIDRKLAEIKICDPAVGSGAFPVGMMSEIVKARDVLTTYLNTKDTKGAKENGSADGSSSPLQGGQRGVYAFKRECIENSLYGVDIDAGAVEIAKLRLWLSLVVDEDDPQNIKPLPNLDYKIVCGNSLIGFPENWGSPIEKEIESLIHRHVNETNPSQKDKLKKLIDEKLEFRYKNSLRAFGYRVTFDFKTVFSDAFSLKGGFDIVMGNPPYNAELTITERKFFKDRFESVSSGRQDTCAIFVERAKQISNARGNLSYILPYRLFSRKRNHGQFQIWMLNHYALANVIYLGSEVGFSANDEFMIVLANSTQPKQSTIRVASKPSMQALANNNIDFETINQSVYIDSQEINLSLLNYDKDFLNKIKIDTLPLEDICNVRDGIVPYIREKLVSTKKIDSRYVKFAGIAGKYNLERYHFSCEPLWLCYDINEAKKYIKDDVELRKVQLREKNIFLSRKIITSQNSAVLKGTIDESQIFVSNSIHSTYLKEETKDEYYLEYILGLINSKLINYYHDSLRVKATDLHPQILVSHLKLLPIKKISKSKQVGIVKLVERILAAKRADPLADTSELEREIDQLVYQLYGLTPEEIAIVEGK